MASLTYTALRGIEASGYLKAAADISVAAGDDSFNSVSTDLTGLLTGQWVNSSGFANAVNNGWFHINANSLLHKVTQDTTASLTTEAAGPAITLTGYKRGYGQSYSIDFSAEGLDRTPAWKRSSHQPIGPGNPETVFWREEVYVDVNTDLIDEATLPQWREFLSSVQSGEQFTIDRYGTVASPIEPKVAIVVSDTYTEKRAWPAYPGKYKIAFKVRILN